MMKSSGLRNTLLLLALLLIVPGRPASDSAETPLAAPRKRSSSAIAITADGRTLLVVNPDSNSLTLIDTAGPAVLAEIPVGVDPRTVTVDDAGARAYVTNRMSDSVSVVDVSARSAIAELPVGDRPYGLVLSPDDDQLYVAEQGFDSIAVIKTATLATAARYSVADRPSGLAISEDGRTLIVTHLYSNAITLLTVQPRKLYLPVVSGGEMSARLANVPAVSVNPGGASLPSRSVALWPDSNLVQSVVLSPDGTFAYLPHMLSNTGNRLLTFSSTVFPRISVVDMRTLQHRYDQVIDLGFLDPPGVGLPFDGAVTPDGAEFWVANAASNDLSLIDLADRTLLAHVEVGDNPRGVVLSPDGTRAYVNNTLAGTVSVVDTAAYTVTQIITATEIPLPPALLNGKRLFHSSDDPRVSLAQWISCNTCHFEGEHDGRTWFFSFAGPRNTSSLAGMIETYPLRWSGEWDESADAEFANRRENFGSGLIDGELYCDLSPPDCLNQLHDLPERLPNQGRSYDLDCLAAFIDSLPIRTSPDHAEGAPLSAAESRGKEIFEEPALDCVTCHPPPLYTDLQRHDVGTATIEERIGPKYDTPSLRGLYDSAPYFHDGSAPTLYDTLTRSSTGGEHDVSAALSEEQIQDLIAFLMALPFE